MKNRPDKSICLITLVCILLGFNAVQAFDEHSSDMEIGEVASLQTIERLLKQKSALEGKKQELDQEMALQESTLAGYENSVSEDSDQLQQIREETQDARLLAGLLPVEGPGIEIILNDRKRDSILSTNPTIMQYYVVHDSDLLNVINELREAGAEAIAVNNTRIMANSRISCGGPTINVGAYERFAPPFIIHAIGDPGTLVSSFRREDSIYHDLVDWGLEFQIRKMDRVEIPRYLGDVEYKYAKAVEEGE